ncbi:hypothetical protein DFJ74DRAFT_654687 [Hyaloraphidium curvatum]|nr:hypothetical protein DFJ74DRAFT_654687 [Hyaloraphidium curvatum]
MLHVTVIFVADLFFVAASNAEIAALSALFRQASIEVREASLRSGAGTAREVEGLLLAYADGRQYQSRFVGYVVSADVARTAVVTFVTVAVAAYTILRGTGLYVSPGNVCGT